MRGKYLGVLSAGVLLSALAAALLVDGVDATEYTASIGYFGFYPTNLTVQAGDVVRWNNAGPAAHTVTSENGSWGSGVLVIGDSFTANVTSTLRWTDVAEDALNASSDWTRSVGGRTTRVINFGLDGIGTGQFGAVVERLALPFDLDLLIVNMLKDDLIRRPGDDPEVRSRRGVAARKQTHRASREYSG